ncbi:MAG: phage regulatory CII family protein [Verrucomicrobiota bacterium]
MESHEVLRDAFDSPTTSPKEIASEMGVSLSLVYKWAQPNTELGSGSRNPLDRVSDLIDLTKHSPILEWLCQKSGGYFVRNPKSSCEEGYEVFPATHTIVQQFAGLLDVVSKAAEDNTITADESAQIRRVWDELKSFCEGFVRCCEEGDFEQIQRELKNQD